MFKGVLLRIALLSLGVDVACSVLLLTYLQSTLPILSLPTMIKNVPKTNANIRRRNQKAGKQHTVLAAVSVVVG